MTIPVSLLLLAAIGIGTSCGVNRLSDRQQQQLEDECHCRCERLDTANPQVMDAWLTMMPGVMHMAWGGGVWLCSPKRTR